MTYADTNLYPSVGTAALTVDDDVNGTSGGGVSDVVDEAVSYP